MVLDLKIYKKNHDDYDKIIDRCCLSRRKDNHRIMLKKFRTMGEERSANCHEVFRLPNHQVVRIP